MPGIRRLSAVATVGVLAVVTFGIWSGVRPAAAWAGSAPTIGPVQISALGRPGLCWEAGGNGSAVTLEHCDAAVQGQQWSLTGNGVVMNGNGYCLEAQGQPAGQALYIDFAGQCAGAGQGLSGQVWRYQAGQLASTGTGACAAAAGPLWPGTEIVRRACPPGAPRWNPAVGGIQPDRDRRAPARRLPPRRLLHRPRPRLGNGDLPASRYHPHHHVPHRRRARGRARHARRLHRSGGPVPAAADGHHRCRPPPRRRNPAGRNPPHTPPRPPQPAPLTPAPLRPRLAPHQPHPARAPQRALVPQRGQARARPAGGASYRG